MRRQYDIVIPISVNVAVRIADVKPIVAVDIPSGLDCDTGLPLGPAVRAAATVTFLARKVGFDAPGASEFTGQVHVIGIGVPRTLLDAYRVATESPG